MATTVKPSDKVRIGIIGCGGIANGKHLPALHRLSEHAKWSPSATSSARARESGGEGTTARPAQRSTTDYKELLEDETIDVVHVLTPNRSHSVHLGRRAGSRQARHVRKADGQVNAADAQKHGRRRQAAPAKSSPSATRTASATTSACSSRRQVERRRRWAKSTTREAYRARAAERCRPGACSSTSTSRAAVR